VEKIYFKIIPYLQNFAIAFVCSLTSSQNWFFYMTAQNKVCICLVVLYVTA